MSTKDWENLVEVTELGDIKRKFLNTKTGEIFEFESLTYAGTAAFTPTLFAQTPIEKINVVGGYKNKCSYCGRKIKDSQEFCVGCGAPC